MDREWTLTEAARILGEPQHRLIYLCEKGVVVPDRANAAGRGSSRRFSERNLLEFAVALRLRDLTIPVGPIAAIIHVLRRFESVLGRQKSGFTLTKDLRMKSAPELRIVVRDGEQLFFSLGGAGKNPRFFGGIDFRRLTAGKKLRVSEKQLGAAFEADGQDGDSSSNERARLEVNVTQIAKELSL